MNRSVFQKNYQSAQNFVANYTNEIRLITKALVLDIIGHESKSSFSFIEGEYTDGIYFVCALEKNVNILPVKLRGLSYSELKKQLRE